MGDLIADAQRWKEASLGSTAGMGFFRTLTTYLDGIRKVTAADVQRVFDEALRFSHPGTRLILNFYSSLWSPVFTVAKWLGLRGRMPASNWLSRCACIKV